MHPNPVFRGDDHQKGLIFAVAHGFGVVSVSGDNGPVAAHLPIVFNAKRSRAAFHILRSDPLAQADTQLALLVQQKP